MNQTINPISVLLLSIAILALLIFQTGPLALVACLFFAGFLPQLWIGNGRFFLFVFLGFFIPLFPDLGIELWGRVLNWFDIFLLFFGVWNLLHLFGDSVRKKWDQTLKACLLFLSLLAILCLRSPEPLISLREWVSYAVNFFLTYWIMEGFTPRRLRAFLSAVYLSSCLVSLVALWQKLNHFTFPLVKDGEVTLRLGVPGTFEDSLVLSMYAGCVFLLAGMGWLRFSHPGFRLLALSSAICNLLSLWLALSRSGIFIAAVGLGFYFFLRILSWVREYRRAMGVPVALLSAPLAAVGGLWALPQDLYDRLISAFYLLSGTQDPVILYNIRSTLGRLENYKASLKLFLANPVEGIGLGLYPYLTRFEDADGFYPGLLAETGLIGCAGFLILTWAILHSIWRNLGRFQITPGENSSIADLARTRLCYELFAGLALALFLVSFFEPVFKIQVLSFIFFFFLRMLQAEAERTATLEPPS